MEQVNHNKPPFQQGQQGSGSSENLGHSREDQKNRNINLDKGQKENIAGDTALSTDDIADLSDLGTLSGRDDASGSSGDRMENENTGKATDH